MIHDYSTLGCDPFEFPLSEVAQRGGEGKGTHQFGGKNRVARDKI